MAKFTILYERTVRVRQYETMKIGLWREYDRNLITDFEAMKDCQNFVDYHIDKKLEELQAQGEDD